MKPPRAFGLQFAAVALFTVSVGADDFKTIDGKEYKNATVSRTEPDGIVLIISSGIVKLYFTELPKEIQEKYHYDPAKATAFSAAQSAEQERLRKQATEAQRKLIEEKNKYWVEHERTAPSSQGERPGHQLWISGTVIEKGNDYDALLIECSGEGHDGYEGATGRVILRNHSNFAMIARGDHVEVLAAAIKAEKWRWEDSEPYLHVYKVPSRWKP